MARVIDNTLSSDARHDRELKEAFYKGVETAIRAFEVGLRLGLTPAQVIESLERSTAQSKRGEL